MTYRTLYSIYVGSAVVFWLILLGGVADRLDLFALVGLEDLWNGLTILATFALAFTLPTVGPILAAVIVWRFRGDRKAMLPAGLFVMACAAFLGSVLVQTQLGGVVYERWDPILMRVLAALLILFGLSATWLAWSWTRNGLPEVNASPAHPGVPTF